MSDNQITTMQINGSITETAIMPINPIPAAEKVLELYFIAYVTIPVGFVVAGNDHITALTLDESTLSVNHIVDTPINLNGKVVCAKECVTLNGDLNYNVILDGFKACEPVVSTALSTYTAFSYSENIPVRKLLATSLYQYNIGVGYHLIAEQGVPFINDCKGRSIYKTSNNAMYMNLLRNPDITRVVNVPYRVIICPYATDQCGNRKA